MRDHLCAREGVQSVVASGHVGVNLRAYAELVRPPNVMTAIADVLAGYAVAGLGNHRALPWLAAASACLYAGGVTLNDFFDRKLDGIERPERPIPSGRVPHRVAATLGALLLAAGILCASQATRAAALLASAIAALILLYDAWGKHQPIVGPLNMGLCRALNLLLGVAAVPAALAGAWALGFVPLVYVGAVTTVSRGEVHGGSSRAARVALISLTGAISALAVITLSPARRSIPGLIVVAALAWRTWRPFWIAYRTREAGAIRRAVKAGVLSLVLVDAAIGAAYAGPAYAAAILATALIAGALARLFAVT
jgi:4-hydroxybenzoate polyprenyltransferase